MKLFFPKAREGVFLFLAFLSFPSFLGAMPREKCSVLEPWLELKRNYERAEIPEETWVHKPRIRPAKVAITEKLFEQYLGSSEIPREPEPIWKRSDLEVCLRDISGTGDFFDTLQATFYRKSFERLKRAAHNPVIGKFLEIEETRTQSGAIPLFMLTGEYNPPPEVFKAGFHRDHRSIYMDMDRIPPNDWLIIFIHENLHSMDDLLEASNQVFSNPNQAKKLETLAFEKKTLADFSPSEQLDLLDWLTSGIHRGLWAEYRAWVTTFVIYREGLKEGLWKPISWMEDIWPRSLVNHHLAFFLYHYLDNQSWNPSKGMFGQEPVVQAVSKIRAEARAASSSLPLGALGEIVKACVEDCPSVSAR